MKSLLFLSLTASLFAQTPNDGQALFSGKGGCSACHQINGVGGVVGPDLSNAGRLTADILKKKILDPTTVTNPGGRGGGAVSLLVAKAKNGQETRGVRRAEDT